MTSKRHRDTSSSDDSQQRSHQSPEQKSSSSNKRGKIDDHMTLAFQQHDQHNTSPENNQSSLLERTPYLNKELDSLRSSIKNVKDLGKKIINQFNEYKIIQADMQNLPVQNKDAFIRLNKLIEIAENNQSYIRESTTLLADLTMRQNISENQFIQNLEQSISESKKINISIEKTAKSLFNEKRKSDIISYYEKGTTVVAKVARELRKAEQLNYCFTSKGRTIQIPRLDLTPASSDEEIQNMKNLGYADTMQMIEPPTANYNSFGYTFLDKKRLLAGQEAKKILEDNFTRTTTPNLGDAVIYQNFFRQITYSGIVEAVEDNQVTEISSKLSPTGGLYKHHPDLIKNSMGNWEVYHKDASLITPSILTQEYTTTKGTVITMTIFDHKGVPNGTLEQEQQYLNNKGYTDKVRMIESPTSSYNCFSYAFLEKKGWFEDIQAIKTILQDDFTQTKTPQLEDIVIYRHPQTREIQHAGIVKEITDEKISQIWSKWDKGALYEHHPDTPKDNYGTWEVYHRISAPNLAAC